MILDEDEGESLSCRQQMAPKGATIRKPGDMGKALRVSQGVSCPGPSHLDPNGIQDTGHNCKDPWLSLHSWSWGLHVVLELSPSSIY